VRRRAELRLYDLVVSSDSFSVGFMELGGGHTPPFVGIRSPYAEFASARDAKGNSYVVVAAERIGSLRQNGAFAARA